jgi:hypothetical protein
MDHVTKEDPADVPQITVNRHQSGSINTDQWKRMHDFCDFIN